jgi:hypothetical protein
VGNAVLSLIWLQYTPVHSARICQVLKYLSEEGRERDEDKTRQNEGNNKEADRI